MIAWENNKNYELVQMVGSEDGSYAYVDSLGEAQLVLGDKELELPPQGDFEIAYKLKKKGGHQIEVEIEWGKSKGVPLLAIS